MEWTHRRRFNRRYDIVVDVVPDRQEVTPDGRDLRVFLRVENPRLVRRRGRLRRAV
jgi:hypothetical protein